MTRDQFIEEIAAYIQQYAPLYDINVCSPIIAQAVLESAGGTSELAVNAHNYFGLKYRKDRCPTACGIYYKTGAEQNADGSYTSSAMQWMKFPDMEACVKGYFDFINVPAYENLKGVTEPREYLQRIKSDGYATSINYTDKLMNVITAYNLTGFDKKFDKKEDQSAAICDHITCKVAVDAGHGSNTAGKRSPDGYREHWINVKCADYFDAAMRRCGIETLRVGWNDQNSTDDPDTALSARQQQIKNAGCDLSVSWHANAHGDGKEYTSAQGIETFIHSDSGKAGDSKALADKVQAYLIQGTKQNNRGVKTQNLAMCNCSAMGTAASILIETGFMTNAYEEALLKSDTFCLECAEEAAQGVCDYLGVLYKAGASGKYIRDGIDYSLVFNPSFYANQYADLKKAFGENSESLFQHFVDYGMREGRQASGAFNVKAYQNNYEDLQNAFGNDLPSYYKHYIRYGYKEGRKAV